MRRAARAAALGGALVAAGCATARPGGSRLSIPPREAEPGCVARGVRVAGPPEAQPLSGRAAFDFWVEADGSPGPIEAASWQEGLGLEPRAELANQVARAVARCRWLPGAVEGRPVRALVRLPLRLTPSAEVGPETTRAASARETIRPAREAVPGCVPRALPLPAGIPSGPLSRATFLVTVEADGSSGSVALVSRPDLDPEPRRALVEAVAGAAGGCRFQPGTVDGQPARTFWLVEVQLTGPAAPPAGPSP